MSNYYEFKEAKVTIANALREKGWNIFGYKADTSDGMTDYYNPAHWEGIAEKNGYIVVVDCFSNSNSGKEIKHYNYNNEQQILNNSVNDKIKKLESMTVSRGASEQEEQTALDKIAILQAKEQPETEKYIVTGKYPEYQPNPPHTKWHVEKDGVIILKGNGIAKFSQIDNFTENERTATMDSIRDGLKYYYSDPEKLEQCTISTYESIQEKKKLQKTFDTFINKIDTSAGATLGEGEMITYENVIKTEYKKENKVVRTATGSVKDGQCFILVTSFNYGCNKGYVYRIHANESNGKVYYKAVKLNNKLTKECTGSARGNHMFSYSDAANIQKWVDKGSISFCDIEEVLTPYQVEKCVKKVNKSEKKEQPAKKESKVNTENKTTEQEEPTKQPVQAECNDLHFDIKEDTDTRNNNKIYVVKVVEKLDRDEYLKVNSFIKSIGGYYSKFKHGFIFKENPTELLNGNDIELKSNTEENKTETEKSKENKTEEQTAKQPQAETKKQIDFEIEQSQHTKTKENIWLVKIKDNLSKDDFAEVKRNFATLKGFYSSFNNSFIFKYDPTEKIKSAA